jgi:putative holliday junction resolvase
MGRVLALDYGSVRVGVAISDALRITAQPLEVIRLERVEERLPALLDGVDLIIVGLPRSLDGTEGPSALAAREFAERVRSLTGLPVEMVDERLTTTTAERALIEGGVRRSTRRQVVDKVAATVLLEGYLGSPR